MLGNFEHVCPLVSAVIDVSIFVKIEVTLRVDLHDVGEDFHLGVNFTTARVSCGLDD